MLELIEVMSLRYRMSMRLASITQYYKIGSVK